MLLFAFMLCVKMCTGQVRVGEINNQLPVTIIKLKQATSLSPITVADHASHWLRRLA